jgi:hypothetical protein
MNKVKRFGGAYRTQNASLVAGQQWGVISRRQLLECGVSADAVKRWRADGKLHVIHRGVYALGHRSVPIEGRLVAAVLHGGAGSVLSHATAAWWWGIVPNEPKIIEVSTKSGAGSTEGVRVHHPRHVRATTHRRFPITTLAQTLLDFAAHASLNALRRALAEVDYRRLLKIAEVEAVCGHGRIGSKKLRQALERHQPRLALTRSELELLFFALCESAGIPPPQVNAQVSRMRIDMVWPEHGLAVELDGHEGHRTPAQIERDRRRELHARMAGYVVIRYTWSQVVFEPDLVVADLRRQFSLLARSVG